MAIQINGNGTITGINVGGLPDGIVDTDMIANNAVTDAKSTIVGGKILQVKNYYQSTSPTTTSSSYADTGLAVSITPSATTSKIHITGNVLLGQNCQNYGEETGLKLFRGSTELWSRGDFFRIFENGQQVTRHYAGQMIQHLDSPSATIALTYKIQWATANGGTVYMLQGSNITVMEVAA